MFYKLEFTQIHFLITKFSVNPAVKFYVVNCRLKASAEIYRQTKSTSMHFDSASFKYMGLLENFFGGGGSTKKCDHDCDHKKQLGICTVYIH